MENVLLVIDDHQEICKMMQRTLRRSFDAIHVASCADEALPLLEREPITHVVCDLFLGKDEPLGCELVRDWRKLKSTIRYVALFTGSSLDALPVFEGIDGVFQKPNGLVDLMKILKSERLEERVGYGGQTTVPQAHCKGADDE